MCHTLKKTSTSVADTQPVASLGPANPKPPAVGVEAAGWTPSQILRLPVPLASPRQPRAAVGPGAGAFSAFPSTPPAAFPSPSPRLTLGLCFPPARPHVPTLLFRALTHPFVLGVFLESNKSQRAFNPNLTAFLGVLSQPPHGKRPASTLSSVSATVLLHVITYVTRVSLFYFH